MGDGGQEINFNNRRGGSTNIFIMGGGGQPKFDYGERRVSRAVCRHAVYEACQMQLPFLSSFTHVQSGLGQTLVLSETRLTLPEMHVHYSVWRALCTMRKTY